MALSSDITARVTPFLPGSLQGSGAVSVSSSGGVWTISFTSSGISVNSLGLDKLEQVASNVVLGNPTTGSADVTTISIAPDLEFDGSSTMRVAAFGGDVSKTAGATALAIASYAVTGAKVATNTIEYSNIVQLPTLTVMGNFSGATADVQQVAFASAATGTIPYGTGTGFSGVTPTTTGNLFTFDGSTVTLVTRYQAVMC